MKIACYCLAVALTIMAVPVMVYAYHDTPPGQQQVSPNRTYKCCERYVTVNECRQWQNQRYCKRAIRLANGQISCAEFGWRRVCLRYQPVTRCIQWTTSMTPCR